MTNPQYIQCTYAYHDGKPYLAVATVPLKPAEPAIVLKFKPGQEDESFESATRTWGTKPVSEAESLEAREHALRLVRSLRKS